MIHGLTWSITKLEENKIWFNSYFACQLALIYFYIEMCMLDYIENHLFSTVVELLLVMGKHEALNFFQSPSPHE